MSGIGTTLFPLTASPDVVVPYLSTWTHQASAERISFRPGNNEGITTKTVSVVGTGPLRKYLFYQAVSDPLQTGVYLARHGLTRASRASGSGTQLQFLCLMRTIHASGAVYSPIQTGIRHSTPVSGIVTGLSTYLKTAAQGFADSAGLANGAAAGEYALYDFTDGDRMVFEFGVSTIYNGTVDCSIEVGHSAALPLLSYSERGLAGNGFFQIVQWADASQVNQVRYTRPFAATHHPDRIQYPSVAPTGEPLNTKALNS